MKRLDCESRTTALKSLADITGIDAERIWDVFLKYDYVSEYDNGRFPCDFLDFLYNSFMEHFEIQNVEIDEICWFHLTRTLHPKLFKTHGILPRKDAYLLLSQAECRTLNPCSPIFTKECQGPFAMLVKDIAFCPEATDHHDYLKVPELMEDMGLSSIYEENGTSIIIKFVSKPEFEPYHYLKHVLYYLYNSRHMTDLDMYCNTCFNAEGIPVLPNSFLYIEEVK